MKVIGMDTNSRGFHWVSNFGIGMSGSDAGEKYGWIECDDPDPAHRSLKAVEYGHALFKQLSVDNAIAGADSHVHVVCEEPLALQNGKTTRLLGLAAGAIFGAFVVACPDATWHWIDQSSWKKAVLGRGRRPNDFVPVANWPKAKWEKAWIVETCRSLPGFMVEEDPVRVLDFDSQQDLYDAWAIRVYGARTFD